MRVRVCDCMISFSCLVQSQEQTITITIQCNNYSLFFCTKANGRFKRNLLEQPCRVENSYIFFLIFFSNSKQSIESSHNYITLNCEQMCSFRFSCKLNPVKNMLMKHPFYLNDNNFVFIFGLAKS